MPTHDTELLLWYRSSKARVLRIPFPDEGGSTPYSQRLARNANTVRKAIERVGIAANATADTASGCVVVERG